MTQAITIFTLQRNTLATLIIVAALLMPHMGLTGHVFETERLIFDRSNGSQASIMHVAPEPSEPYSSSKKMVAITVTSYNSEPGQTDSTPFITAMGTQTRDGIVATNYLPFGTKVRFPDLYGSKVFVVEDRMNARYTKRVDIWSADKEFSRNFGARTLRMEIL